MGESTTDEREMEINSELEIGYMEVVRGRLKQVVFSAECHERDSQNKGMAADLLKIADDEIKSLQKVHGVNFRDCISDLAPLYKEAVEKVRKAGSQYQPAFPEMLR